MEAYPNAVQDRLGHASTEIALNMYLSVILGIRLSFSFRFFEIRSHPLHFRV